MISKHFTRLIALLLILPQATYGIALPHLPVPHNLTHQGRSHHTQTGQMKLNTPGMFENNGTVISDTATNLTIGDLINHGSIRSGGTLYIQASNDIINLSGSIAGKDVTLKAGRDIRNERKASHTEISTQLWREASISAENDLNLAAGRDLAIVAASVKTGGNASLSAGNNITVDTLATQQNSSGAYNAYINRTTHLGSQLAIGGNLTMQAGNDLQLTAANVNVGGNMALHAGGDISLGNTAVVATG